jgi:hypothetical protein
MCAFAAIILITWITIIIGGTPTTPSDDKNTVEVVAKNDCHLCDNGFNCHWGKFGVGKCIDVSAQALSFQ